MTTDDLRSIDYTETVATSTIDGILYESSKLPATTSLGIIGRLTMALSEPGLRMVVGGGSIVERVKASIGAGGSLALSALVQLAEALARDPKLPVDILANTRCGSLRPAGIAGALKQREFDLHFAGELPHLVSVLEFVIRHNYTGFTLGSLSTSGSRSSHGTVTDAGDSSA